ncbi:MAG: ATP-dependent acyl-CoA ligase, partial [Gammaproteobacteria bacterium]|nr:ATP-dependent acyl-CoA ligase [Gammaproteobacteria bacterium]
MTKPDRIANPLSPGERTLPAMIQQQRVLFGSRPCVRIGDREWTHADVSDAASLRAASLADAGVTRGDRVALMSGNRIEFLEVFLGCGWMGAVSVPINTASMAPQIEYVLAQSKAVMLVIEAGFIERLQAVDFTRTSVQRIWVLQDEASPIAWEPQGLLVKTYPEPSDAVSTLEVQPSDTLAILYTSGTTGPAKGVMCSHAQFCWWGVNSADILGVVPDDVLASTLPLFHINALNTFAQAMMVGCQTVFESHFSASAFWSDMRNTKATVVYLLGAMVPILLAQPPTPGEKDHRVRLGLGPGVPEAAANAFLERTGVPLVNGYGSTETNFVIATALGSTRTGGVMGRLRPGFQAKVADEGDVELPDGQAGELLLRADEPNAFASGYFDMPAKTVEAWRNLWFHTGDRVVREADGAFRFVDRIHDAIRRRGENISSYEVEQVLLSHPDVATCAVFPVRSDLAEDEVMAVVVARPGKVIDLAELALHCEPRLPYFAVPRFIDVLLELPRTENGKVQKYKLREAGVTATTWDRGPSVRPAASPRKGR